MTFIAHQMALVTLMAFLITIDFFFLYISQGVLRVLHLPVNWITWLIGAVLIVASALTCVFIFVQNRSLQYTFTNDALLGIFSFMVAVYGLSQWTMRHWYVFVKKRTIPFISQQSRTMLLFLRKHHQFFGWVVVATAVGHAISYLPIITRLASHWIITGIIGLVLLIPLVGIGYWIEFRAKKKRLTKGMRVVHLLTGIAFFVIILVHIGVGMGR